MLFYFILNKKLYILPLFQMGKDPDVRIDKLFVVGKIMPIEVIMHCLEQI